MENLVFLTIVLLDILLLLGVVALSIYIFLLFVDVSLEISECFSDFFERRKEKKRASLKGTRVSEQRENKWVSCYSNMMRKEEGKDE